LQSAPLGRCGAFQFGNAQAYCCLADSQTRGRRGTAALFREYDEPVQMGLHALNVLDLNVLIVHYGKQ
jgi:hypothetical protein